MAKLKDVHDVIRAFGGCPALARLTGRTYRAAHNWQQQGWLPPTTYDALTKILAKRGHKADPAIWRMEGPYR